MATARRSGLGKGLASLIPPGASDTDGIDDALRELSVTSIAPNPGQPRAQFDEESLSELTTSIRALGVLQPILVRELDGDQYQLIAGERRWRAARRAGLSDHPGHHPPDRRSGRGRAGTGRERPTAGPHGSGGGGGLPGADRGLRPDPRRGGVPGRQEPIHRDQHRPPAPAASGCSAHGGRRAAHGRPRPRVCWPRRTVPSRSSSPGGRSRSTGRCARRKTRCGRGPRRTPRTAPPLRAPAPVAGLPTLRPPGLLELESLLAEYLNTRVSITMRGARGKVAVEFATLEDLERIYRLITENTEHTFE